MSNERAQDNDLAIGGHVGDMELYRGRRIGKPFAEGGSHRHPGVDRRGARGPAGRDMAEYREQKVNEAKAFAEMLGGEAIVFDTPDGELQDNEENRLKVCDVIREVRPNIIITHFKNSMHMDHMTDAPHCQ